MEHAFNEMINTHRGILYKVCKLYGADHEDQKDLFQEMVLQHGKLFPGSAMRLRLLPGCIG